MALSLVGESLLGQEQSWLGRWVVRLGLAAQLIVGLVVWCSILNWGNIPFEMGDWYDVTGPRLRFIQQAMLQGELPLHSSSTVWAKGFTDRFLSIPDQILSPQVLLLRWLSPDQFSLIQVLLLYCVGYAGLLRLRKKYGLSLAAFLPLAWLFSFNGHIVDQLSVGHLTWGGYFLLPFFIELVLILVEDGAPKPVGWWAPRFALLQGVILLQGAIHLFTLNLIFLGLLLVWFRRRWKTLAAAGVASLLLCMFRILPAAIVAGQLEIHFSSGFTTVNELLKGLVELKTVSQALDSLTPVTPQVAWWEFDYYVSWAGLLWLAGFGILYWFRKQQSSLNIHRLLSVLGALSILSIGRVYNVIFVLQIPLLNGERITSRFFVLVVLIIAVIASIGMQRWLDTSTSRVSTRMVIYGGAMILLVNDLRQHYELWKVSQLGSLFLPMTSPIQMELANRNDPLYVTMLAAGAIISTASLAITIAWLLLSNRQKPNPA